MAKKNVRVYFSTFIDVELESAEFADDSEMRDYVEDNISVWLDDRSDEIMSNLAMQECNSDVTNI